VAERSLRTLNLNDLTVNLYFDSGWNRNRQLTNTRHL